MRGTALPPDSFPSACTGVCHSRVFRSIGPVPRGDRHVRPPGQGRRVFAQKPGNWAQAEYLKRPETVCRLMAAKKPAADGATKSVGGFSDEERAAVKDRALEQKIVWGKNRAEDERAVLAKISQMPEPDRSLGKRLHEVLRASAPTLSPRLWYGMPAYTKDGEVLCFFQPAHKFKTRYGTLGFSDKAALDEGAMWPTVFALKVLNAPEEARVAALVKRAVG